MTEREREDSYFFETKDSTSFFKKNYTLICSFLGFPLIYYALISSSPVAILHHAHSADTIRESRCGWSRFGHAGSEKL